MSNTMGHVVYEDSIVGYFEYYGSSSMASSIFYSTELEVHEHWRQRNAAVCTCGQPPVSVKLFADYGCGYWWPSEACLACKAITGERQSDESEDGHPLGPAHETEWNRLCKDTFKPA